MGTRIGRAVEGLIVVAVIALVVGQALGQPLLLGYVRTGSMEPTLAPGDGFVALPPAVTGPPDRGDVIVYRAERLNGGGLTTHRVVGTTDRGYVTRGDANPFTDQSSGEPPVRRPQIVAVALQAGGGVVVLPGLGTVATTVRDGITGLTGRGGPLGGIPRSLWIGLAAAGLVVLLGGATAEGRTPVSERDAGRRRAPSLGPREYVLLAGVVVVVAATASSLVPPGPTEYEVVSAQGDVPGPAVIPAGESETTTYRIPGGRLLPTRYHVTAASEGVAVVANGSGTVAPGGTANATVRLSAPPEIGSYRRYVAEHRYPLVLPRPLVDALYRIDPLAPVLALDACLAVPFLLAARLVGGGRRRPRGSPGAATGLDRLLGGEGGGGGR